MRAQLALLAMNFFGRPKEPAAKPRVDPEQVMRQLTELSTKISETEKKCVSFAETTTRLDIRALPPLKICVCAVMGRREHSFKVAEQFRQRARLAMKAGRRDGMSPRRCRDQCRSA